MNHTAGHRARFARVFNCAATFALGTIVIASTAVTRASVEIAPVPLVTTGAPPAVAPDPVAMIYAISNKDLLWSAYGQPRELAYEALEALQQAPVHGLDPERYALEALYVLIQNAQSDEQLQRLDHLLTTAIWSYSEDLRIGAAHERSRSSAARKAVGYSENHTGEPAAPVDRKALQALANAIESGSLRTHLDGLPPNFETYRELQRVLDRYNDYQLLGGWEELPPDMLLKPWDTHPSVVPLRYRLILTDGLPAEAFGSEVYDEEVQGAILRFQQRHGLAADGQIGPATLKALNISCVEKIRRISLNLARLRQLPKELPQDYIRVNIPEFKLQLIRDNEEALNMGVVVGSRRTPTPAMQDQMRHLVFNPYWYPPHNITVQEILPKLRENPEYLEQNRFELLRGDTVVDAKLVNWKQLPARNFPFRLRQLPGEKNSLGEVKFIFPNEKAIYLHDTPARKLFGERVRAFSHGCIRLEKPRELATVLMDWDRGWTEEEVLADIETNARKLRKFSQTMAIYLLYQTTTVSEGLVSFHPDIYGHDVSTQDAPLRAPLIAAALRATDSRPEPDKQVIATR